MLHRVKRHAKLNDRQLSVLRQVAEGDGRVGAHTPDLAVTVYALRSRGLVATPRENGVWTARITESGRFYLHHGRHPDPQPARSGSTDAAGLIRRLENEGTLRIVEPDDATRAEYRRAIHAAKQRGMVPEGRILRHTGRNGGDLVIKLDDAENPDETEWNRIRLGGRDQVATVSELRNLLQAHPEVLQVSEAVRERALDLVELLSRASVRRGHKLAISKKR